MNTAERLAAGVKAAIFLRLIAGNTNQTYTPTEVSTMVSAVVDEQYARLIDPQVIHEEHADRGEYDPESCSICMTAAENQTMDVA